MSAQIRDHAGRYRDIFLGAEPFRHVVIDNFFEPAFAERLLAEFPQFDPKLAIAENGTVGGKAVNPRIREISPVYRELYEAISSAAFLGLVSELSGIPDLLLDPTMFGGGIHDNLDGQELDPHVDFNYHEELELHRRLNLIVYLNEEWKSEWGGALEIHSNPRKPFENRVWSYNPLFNRCVMFETNERSWHGFPQINLPPDRRHLSRKSISIYLYTKDRPAEEIAPTHGTFYVQRFLPEHIAAGHTLTEEDVELLRRLLIRRDGWIEMYQRMELNKNRDIAEKNGMIAIMGRYARAPVTGYLVQQASQGVYWDAWVETHAQITLRPLVPVSGMVLRGWRPDAAPGARIHIAIDGEAAGVYPIGGGSFACRVRPSRHLRDTFCVSIDFEAADRGAPSADDPRDLAFLLTEVRARHPWLSRSSI